MQINWESFSVNNQDARGIRYKFEDMCRQLFALENLSANKSFKYLHAEPNNHGLETEPIYDEVNNRWIGFQAKFFDTSADYTQIYHSAEKIVNYYSTKVDLVFLYCNKPLTSTSLSRAKTLLQSANIELQLVTDTAILDLVRLYPHIGLYYFGNHTINPAWFQTHSQQMYQVLGERYNPDFNVDTDYLDELSLFVHDERAVNILNAKKSRLHKELDDLYWSFEKHRDYIREMKNALSGIPNVAIENLDCSITWKDTLLAAVQQYIKHYEQELEILYADQSEQYKAYRDLEKTKKERDTAYNAYRTIGKTIDDIHKLIQLPDIIEISDKERQLFSSNILALYGKAGTGKSQLLATKTQSLIDESRSVLLLIAGIYFTDAPIQEQIMKNIGFDFAFEEMIEILEAIGEKENRIVPIFIDALNETWNNELWKTGLSILIDQINQYPMVRLVFSYRTEYEQLILPDSIRERTDKVVRIENNGFVNNSIDAAQAFFNHYNIPFTPLEFIGYEIENPLFLTIYCKTYDGQEVSLPELYEKLLKRLNKNLYHTLKVTLKNHGYTEDYNLLHPLIINLTEYFIINGKKHITKIDLKKLTFWADHDLAAPPFIEYLVKENLLYTYVVDGEEVFYFAYDQMNDYYCAKAIMEMYSNKDDLKKYSSDKVLEIQDGKLKHYDHIDLFINVCALYAEKYGEECIDIIDDIEDSIERNEVFSKYLSSFQWRKAEFLPIESFLDLIRKYPCVPEDVWQMLIGNSVKTTHPFNADYLHKFLSKYPINKRDKLWTCYINRLTEKDSDRLIQLVQMYNNGEKFRKVNDKQIELLLTLFGWILTSSNRWLRDYTSKAMTEILKEHFSLCQPLLSKFKDVNDPYVVQRLYGIVFGACCKRKTQESLKTLAEYVYSIIFEQEKIYPDILLRDYARLIIEKFLSEEPDYCGYIHREKIIPPYNSDPIPQIEDQHYLEKDYHGSLYWLINSMRFEGMGMYGDFGRYIFQSAIQYFDVNDKEIFNYAIYYIINELGFRGDYFDEHDQHCGSYDRLQNAKTERIGKKYQWIAMHNILARLSDHCKMIDLWNYPEKEDMQFEGPWEPYVRDYDPTLNSNFMVCDDAPVFDILKTHVENGIKDNKEADLSNATQRKEWLTSQGYFLGQLKDTLILTDNNGQQWVSLTKYCHTKLDNVDQTPLTVWGWLYAYFVSPEQAVELLGCAQKGLSVISSTISYHHETYSIFNREYPWAPSCREFNESAWINVSVKTGEIETVIEKRLEPNLSQIELLIQKYHDANNEFDDTDGATSDISDEIEDFYDTLGSIDLIETDIIQKREVEKDIGKILCATSRLLWESEYDATKEGTISCAFPCAQLIESVGLHQATTDGFLYDQNGHLAAFDVKITQKENTVVVRKDILDSFLENTGYQLIWLVDAEKEIHTASNSIEEWSDWEGVFTYDKSIISGELRILSKPKQEEA